MDTRYLFKRHNTWWVKIAVPRTLRNQLGYDLRQSLKTHNLEEAQDLRWSVIESLKKKIELKHILELKKLIKGKIIGT